MNKIKSKQIKVEDNFDFNNKKVVRLGNPVDAKDGTNKVWVEAQILAVNNETYSVETSIASNKLLDDECTAKYLIDTIIIKETGGEYAGFISIGTTAQGNDIVDSIEVSANNFINCPLGKEVFSTTVDQSLYVSSTESVTDGTWSTGTISVYLAIKKFAV